MEKKQVREQSGGKYVFRPVGRGYMLQLLIHIGISAAVAALVLTVLVTNITAFSAYLYRNGSDSQMVQRFAFGSQLSVLLFVLLGIVLFTLCFTVLQSRTARDIEKLARAVEQISAGDLSTELYIPGEGELSHIAASITRMERDIRELIERERQTEQSKTDLITNVAHDLRTPLTSILGYLDILKNQPGLTEEQQKKYIEIVYNKARRLQKLIEELFGFTKLSYGRVNMHITKLDIVQLLAQLCEESYPSFEKNGLSYELLSDCDSLLMEADGDLLARLFDNLISNAIKYGAEGKRVLLQLHREAETVTVRVTNFGYVIPEKELPLIFDKFYRVEHSRTSSVGGTGLGLAIVKNIAEMHHGQVSVSSGLGGTCFTVQLPLRYEERQEDFSAEKKDEE